VVIVGQSIFEIRARNYLLSRTLSLRIVCTTHTHISRIFPLNSRRASLAPRDSSPPPLLPLLNVSYESWPHLPSLIESIGEHDGSAGWLELERMAPWQALVLDCAPGHPEGVRARAFVWGVSGGDV
jgi:hypothetical protein